MAPTLKVDYCIVCEEIRMEVGNKFTVLGLFGLAPVQILLNLGEVAKVSFLFGGRSEGKSGKALITSNLFSPSRTKLMSGMLDMNINPLLGKVMFGMGFNVVFQEVGMHTIELIVDGHRLAEYSFDIQRRPG